MIDRNMFCEYDEQKTIAINHDAVNMSRGVLQRFSTLEAITLVHPDSPEGAT